MIDPSRVQPEFVGDLVWLRGARGVEIGYDYDTKDKALVVQVTDDGYRIPVPFSAIEPVSTVWAVGQQPGSLAVKRSWWDAQVGGTLTISAAQATEAMNSGTSHAAEAIAEAMALRDSVGPHAPPVAGIMPGGCVQTPPMPKIQWPEDEGPVMESAPTTAADIVLECDRIEKMLLAKNAKYKDSALHPLRLLSKADPLEGIAVRADDKLSRIINEGGLLTALDNDVRDLAGYLILLLVARGGR